MPLRADRALQLLQQRELLLLKGLVLQDGMTIQIHMIRVQKFLLEQHHLQLYGRKKADILLNSIQKAAAQLITKSM